MGVKDEETDALGSKIVDELLRGWTIVIEGDRGGRGLGDAVIAESFVGERVGTRLVV